MTNNLYSIHNTLSARFGDVVAYPSDGYALARIQSAFKAHGDSLTEFQVFNVGSIDIETGVVVPCSPRPLPWTQVGSPSDNGLILDN